MCPPELSLLCCSPLAAPQIQPPVFPKIFIFKTTMHTGTARSALLQPWGPRELLPKGSQPQAPRMWGWAMPCSLLLLQGLWLWAGLCMQSDSRQHQGNAEAGSQLGAMFLTESLHPNRPLAKPREKRRCQDTSALKSESGSCWVSLRGASVHPHTGVQGQCCSRAVLAELWS